MLHTFICSLLRNIQFFYFYSFSNKQGIFVRGVYKWDLHMHGHWGFTIDGEQKLHFCISAGYNGLGFSNTLHSTAKWKSMAERGSRRTRETTAWVE